MRKQFLLYLLVFTFGAFIGWYTYAYKASENIQTYKSLQKDKYTFNLSNRTYQAYKEEDPIVAIWALTNFIEYLENREKSSLFTDYVFTTLIQISHARLALTYKKLDNDEKYQYYINKSVAMANEKLDKELYTVEAMIDFVKSADKCLNN